MNIWNSRQLSIVLHWALSVKHQLISDFTVYYWCAYDGYKGSTCYWPVNLRVFLQLQIVTVVHSMGLELWLFYECLEFTTAVNSVLHWAFASAYQLIFSAVSPLPLMLVSWLPYLCGLAIYSIRELSRSPKSGETPQMSVCGSCLMLDWCWVLSSAFALQLAL